MGQIRKIKAHYQTFSNSGFNNIATMKTTFLQKKSSNYIILLVDYYLEDYLV